MWNGLNAPAERRLWTSSSRSILALFEQTLRKCFWNIMVLSGVFYPSARFLACLRVTDNTYFGLFHTRTLDLAVSVLESSGLWWSLWCFVSFSENWVERVNKVQWIFFITKFCEMKIVVFPKTTCRENFQQSIQWLLQET